MSLAELLGFIGEALTTGSFIPQVFRVYKLKSAKDLSLPFIIAMILGGAFWLTYGIIYKLYPVILWNTLSVALVIGLLTAKLKYGR